MSEKTTGHEQHEALPSPEKHELLTAVATPEKPSKAEKRGVTTHEARTAVAEAQTIEQQPNPLEGLKQAENAPQMRPLMHINRDLRAITLRRELTHIRRQLGAPSRALSHIIHQPVIRAVSEGAGKTVSRPSGLLGGGLVALIGTSGYLYLSRHMGFEYNYGVFLVLFAGGFVLGLILEFLVYLATGSRRKIDS